jgi:D-glycero-D-manno-heptose 1,7-bisphosphate phosphatase
VNNALDNTFPSFLRTVFLDRDGVVNEKMPEGSYVTHWEEFHLLPSVAEAIFLLNQTGLRVIVVSNQRGIALGLYTAADVQAIHAEFQKLLATRHAHVDGFYFCPHDKGQCNCRKPLPGMFEQARADFPDINPANSMMIGDSKPDMEFGQRLGMVTAFIDGPSDKQMPGADAAREMADLHYSSLYGAVEDLLARMRAVGRTSSTICLGFPANPR